MSTTISAYLVTAVGVTVLTIGSFIGLVYRSNENTTDIGAASDINESTTDSDISLDQTTLNDDLKKHVEAMVKQEVKKYRKESEETKDLQTYPYNKGEVEQVLTPELLEEIIEDKVTQVLDKLYETKIQDKIDNLEKKLDLRRDDVHKSETFPDNEISNNDYLERLQKVERYMQEKDSNSGAKYVENIYGFLSSTASKIKELYSQAYSNLPNITNVAVKDTSQQNMWAGQLVDMITFGPILAVFTVVEIFCCFCICRKCCKRSPKPPKPPSTSTSKPSITEKEQYKKLENSLCVISFSEEYVHSYHLPLAKSLTEYMSQGKHGKLDHIKKVTITKPENLNSIPRSKVFIVCVDYNEKNDILEPDSPNKKDLLIRRETVRSLMDSLALVILVYCLEKSSENLTVGDRYAYKLHSKIVAVEETKELDKRKCIFSVYKKLNTFQLGALKQTVAEYLKMREEIIS